MARRASRKRNSEPGDGTATLVSRSAFCVLVGVNEYELSLWEHEELICPATVGDIDGKPEPLYDQTSLKRARLIRTLEELDVNLAGIDVILHLLEQMER
ncbi:MAG: chaperone modulator CbpM [Candidatus Binataceae bacterium]